MAQLLTDRSLEKKQRIFKLSLAAVILVAFLCLFLPLLSPIVMGVIFAFAFEPILKRLCANPQGFRRNQYIVLIVILLFCMFTTPVVLATYKISFYINEIAASQFQKSDLYVHFIELKNHVTSIISRLLSRLNLQGQFNLSAISSNLTQKAGAFFVTTSTKLVQQVPEFLMATLIFYISFYLFLSQASKLKAWFLESNVLSSRETNQLLILIQQSCYSTVVSAFGIGLIQASVVAIGGAIFSIGDVIITFIITFILSFVPVIGAAPVAVIIALYSFMLANTKAGIGMLVIAIIAGTVDNILRPYFVSSSQENVHPLVALLAIIGAVLLMGPLGILVGPVLTGLAAKIIPLFFANVRLGNPPLPSAVEKLK